MICYLYNSLKPRFFAGLIELDPATPDPKIDYQGCNVMFQYKTAGGIIKYFVLLVSQNIDRVKPGKLTATLKSAALWYVSCLVKEDVARFNWNGEWGLMVEYNLVTKNVKLLFNEKNGGYLLSYQDGIKHFGSTDEMENFLTHILGYPFPVAASGKINIY